MTKFHVWSRRQKRQRGGEGDERQQRSMTVADALQMKQDGRVEESIATLLFLMSSSPSEAALARYELALFQLQLGRHEAADMNLAALNFKYRLCNAIFRPPPPTSSSGSRRTSPHVQTLDHALPRELLHALQRAFAGESQFFTQHGYPTPGFFSYNVDVTRQDPTTPTLMHQVVAHLRPFVEAAFPHKLVDHEIRSVEFWAHARDGRSACAHQLHWDLDEGALRGAQAQAVHPAVSSVLFLSEHASAPSSASTGAPTLITDQTLDTASVASEAWLCWPAENRFLMFDGALLHGVVPFFAPGGRAAQPRITLMLGWWTRTFPPSGSNSSGESLGPNMPLPRVPTTVRWMKDFRPHVAHASGTAARRPPSAAAAAAAAAALTHVPGPIWVPVAGTKEDIDEEVADTGGNGAVAFISREELAALRAGNASAAAAPASEARKKAKSDAPSDYVFVGKWFLKRLAEVRDDIV